MSIFDSLCNTCVFALRKQYCFGCGFMLTCPDSVIHSMSVPDNKHCPYLEDPDPEDRLCSIEIRACLDWKEATW
jgi:hypothetical protein